MHSCQHPGCSNHGDLVVKCIKLYMFIKRCHFLLCTVGHVLVVGGQVVTGQGVDGSIGGHVGGGSVGEHVGHEISGEHALGGAQVVGSGEGHEGHEVGERAPGIIQCRLAFLHLHYTVGLTCIRY